MSSTPVGNWAAILTEDLQRHYTMGTATIRALDGVSLEIPEGEFVALLGASGSGKSSLLNLIGGLDHPTSGRIIVSGKNLAELSRQELAIHRRHTVGMVFQAFNLIPRMTVAENVELPMRFAETPSSDRQAAVCEALQRVGLAGRATHRPTELSGGEQQRTALARALVNRPRILLADEPTGNLDSRTGTDILNLIADFNKTLGMTVVMITHERPLAEKYAQRLIFLGDGKLIDEKVNQPRAAAGVEA
jgi:putative ABC transport system ATP-binding protein